MLLLKILRQFSKHLQELLSTILFRTVKLKHSLEVHGASLMGLCKPELPDQSSDYFNVQGINQRALTQFHYLFPACQYLFSSVQRAHSER